MSHDDIVLGEGPDDSPWRPGAQVRFEHAPRRAFEHSSLDADHDPAHDERNRERHGERVDRSAGSLIADGRARAVVGAVLLLTLAVAVAAVVIPGGEPAPIGGLDAVARRTPDDATIGARSLGRDLGGDVTLGPGDVPLSSAPRCPSQRLPSAVDPLWSVELPDARRVVSPVNVTEESVVAVVGFDELTANGLPAVSVVALGLADGLERWRAPLQPATGAHEIVGVVDRAVIVRTAAGPDIAYRRLFAFDEDTGELLWDRGFRGDWSATVETTTSRVYVAVRRLWAASGAGEIVVLDPRTGRGEHIAAGAFVDVDAAGRLVTRVGDEVLATSPTDRDQLGVVAPTDAPFTVAGSQVVVAGADATELSVFSGSAEPLEFPLLGSTGIDAPGFVVYLDSIGGSSLLVLGDGAVHGAQLGEDNVEIRWRVQGVIVDSAPNDRGRSLLLATEGGARQRVIDSSTGRTIVDLDLRPGAYATLSLVGNGVVVLDDVDGEPVRVALDLDGRELWSLPGSGPFAIGRGVVVDVDDDNTEEIVRLAAWADPIEGRAEENGCGSVTTG